jgi:menaquinone-dependent protoporphyrinogen IX oxidase
MKILIVYFSFSGNNRLLAEHLAKRLNCDAFPIVEKKRRTIITIFLDMLFGREPKIEDLECVASNYDRIILVAPIWDSKLANPIRTLIKKEKAALSDYSFISLCGYDRSGQNESITRELLALTGITPNAVFELKISDLFPREKRNDIRILSRYHVTGGRERGGLLTPATGLGDVLVKRLREVGMSIEIDPNLVSQQNDLAVVAGT